MHSCYLLVSFTSLYSLLDIPSRTSAAIEVCSFIFRYHPFEDTEEPARATNPNFKMLHRLIVNQYNFWVVVLVAIGTIATAYGLAIIGSTVGQPNFYKYFNLATQGEPGYTHTTNMIGALNGVNSAGAIAGCLTNAWSAEKYGRKRSMQMGSVVLVVGGALCSGAVDMAMFLVGRFVAGHGAGVLACVVPMYQAEVSTPETRGAMVSITGIM